MRPVQRANEGRLPVEPIERLGQVLGQAVRYVHPEPVGPAVGPEPQRGQEVVPDLAAFPVEVGLLLAEQVQVPLPVGHPGPGRAAEHRRPVHGRLRPVRAPSVAENIPVPSRRSFRGDERGTEPGVPAGRMIRHDVEDDPDPVRVQAGGHFVEVGQRAQSRVHRTVVVDVVAAVREGRRVERAQPDRVDAERGQVRNPGNDAAEIAHAVTVGVGEAARVDLVHHCLPPPVGGGWPCHLHADRPPLT
jgi:hypothetical protein